MKGGHSYAVALLDTQCHKNWISKCLVDRLGKGEDISEEFHPPIVRDVSGHEVASCGTISLEWMWGPEGTKVFDCKFFVFTNSDHLDVIFGVEYIIAQGLIDTPRDVIAPLTPHKKQDTSKYHSNSSHNRGHAITIATEEAREMALRKEEQRKEKAALRAARDQAAQQSRQEQASGTSISQNSRAGAS